MIERLCAMADLPKPKVAIIDTRRPERVRDRPQPEARRRRRHDAGSGSGSSRSEVEGVLAHELSHVANRDVLVMTRRQLLRDARRAPDPFGALRAACSAAAAGTANNNGRPVWLIVLVVSIVTYALSYILIRTISRYREYAADRGSALITGAPEHLMSALQKIVERRSRGSRSATCARSRR